MYVCNIVPCYRAVCDEFLPDRERSIISGERMRQVMFIGHVAVVTQVTVVTLSTVPASTTHSVHMTHSTDDALVMYTCRENSRQHLNIWIITIRQGLCM